MTPFEEAVLRRMDRLTVTIEGLPLAIAALFTTEPEPEPTECQHPEEKRAQLGSGEWECLDCRYRHVPEGSRI